MAAIISLLIVLAFSILITRVAAIALTLTGLSSEAARFQARSAFTGVGFTTNESERVVNHPVRRRILLLLMLLGNAGIVTALASLMLGLINGQGSSLVLRVILLAGGVAVLWGLSSSQAVSNWLSRVIGRLLAKHTTIQATDYARLLHLAGDFSITELAVRDYDWLTNASLAELQLRDEGIMVLGIVRTDGTYLGAPDGESRVMEGDTLILYGRAPALKRLDDRQAGERGDIEHRVAVNEQAEVEREEKQKDPDASSEKAQPDDGL